MASPSLPNSTEASAQDAMDSAVAEAERLIDRFDCHKGRNDLVALQLQQALCRDHGHFDAALVELCLQRLRLSAELQRYPDELL